jgi:hypothetical protein
LVDDYSRASESGSVLNASKVTKDTFAYWLVSFSIGSTGREMVLLGLGKVDAGVPRELNLLFNPTFYFEEKHHEQHAFQ